MIQGLETALTLALLKIQVVFKKPGAPGLPLIWTPSHASSACLFLRLTGEEDVLEIIRSCHEGIETNMLGATMIISGLRRQELPGDMESYNNSVSVSILIVASPPLSFLLFCYNVGKESLS